MVVQLCRKRPPVLRAKRSSEAHAAPQVVTYLPFFFCSPKIEVTACNARFVAKPSRSLSEFVVTTFIARPVAMPSKGCPG